MDIETTGGSARFSRVLEIGVIRVEQSRVVKTFKSFVHPGGRVPQAITALTGITDADIDGAPAFADIADELAEIMDGAVFVAHNVHFDYGFLRMEFDRLGVAFSPRLLCTVRLSRKLYPQYKSHKLSSVIERLGLNPLHRHRAYDDAEMIWQFYQHILSEFDLDTVTAAVKAQVKTPSVPHNLDQDMIARLPDSPGVYIFEDSKGSPLYVGKSKNIRTRVRSHFSQYHSHATELRISQQIHNIRTILTHGELGALLTESDCVKEMQPLHNRRLRKRTRVILAKKYLDTEGYYRLRLEDAEKINHQEVGQVMAVYRSLRSAQGALYTIGRNFYLCTRLMNLDKGKGGCFQVQLKKCWGACTGAEDSTVYNERFLSAFDNQRLMEWPYSGPVLITERDPAISGSEGFLVDQWCLVARLKETEFGVEQVRQGYDFDLDMYKILRAFLLSPANRRFVKVLQEYQAQQLLAV